MIRDKKVQIFRQLFPFKLGFQKHSLKLQIVDFFFFSILIENL